jgi:putative acetyltransferase
MTTRIDQIAGPERRGSVWRLRPFQYGDAPGVRRLIEAVWHEHFDRHPDPFVRNFIYSRLSDVDEAERVYRDRAMFLCAVLDADIVGTGAIKHLNDRECEMTRMFVAATCRGRGIGRSIADELIKFARRAGYDHVRLSSNNVLTASHRLYERLGFQSVSSWEPDGDAHSRYYVLRIG